MCIRHVQVYTRIIYGRLSFVRRRLAVATEDDKLMKG
jgi:hypothetical protein